MASTDTVTVACKMPNGLLAEVADLEWFDIKDEKLARKSNIRRFRFNGSADERRVESAGIAMGETPNVVGGYGLTHNVPADFWERWIAENADFAPVKAGLIFANPKPENASAKAREQRSVKSGLEPLRPPDVDRDGRVIGEIDPRVGSDVMTADKPV